METNNQTFQKGTISSVEGPTDRNGDNTTARVIPATGDGAVTRPLTLPWWLRGSTGNLKPGDEVAYAKFEDGTGIILSRMDGEWSGVVAGDVTISEGSVTVEGSATTKEGVTVQSGGITVNGDASVSGGVSVDAGISAGGSVTASGVTAGGISLTSHTHTGVNGETSGPH